MCFAHLHTVIEFIVCRQFTQSWSSEISSMKCKQFCFAFQVLTVSSLVPPKVSAALSAVEDARCSLEVLLQREQLTFNILHKVVTSLRTPKYSCLDSLLDGSAPSLLSFPRCFGWCLSASCHVSKRGSGVLVLRQREPSHTSPYPVSLGMWPGFMRRTWPSHLSWLWLSSAPRLGVLTLCSTLVFTTIRLRYQRLKLFSLLSWLAYSDQDSVP